MCDYCKKPQHMREIVEITWEANKFEELRVSKNALDVFFWYL